MNSEELPVEAGSLGNCVFARIRSLVLNCELRPGSQIYEQELATRFGVSKSPVREALQRLQAQNLIEVLPRKGYRVRPISLSDATEMYEMRLLLEPACVMRAIDTATDSELQSLSSFKQISPDSKLPAWIDHNRMFHVALANACGSTRLARATIEVSEQFDRLTYIGVVSRGGAFSLARFLDEHSEIIDVVQQREKRQAVALIKDHIESSRKCTLAAIADLVVVL